MPSSRLLSAPAVRVTLLTLAAVGAAIFLKSRITIPITSRKAARLHSARKHWPSPVHIALGAYTSCRKLIGWYEAGKGYGYEQDVALRLRGVREHSVAVEMHLNEAAYRVLPRSLGAPWRLGFDGEACMVVGMHVRMSIGEMKELVGKCLFDMPERSQQLRLTEYSHWNAGCAVEVVRINSTAAKWHNYDTILAQHAGRINAMLDTRPFTNHTPFDTALLGPALACALSSYVDCNELTRHNIAPWGFEKCIPQIIPPAPWDEPAYTRPLRKHAPRHISIPFFSESKLEADARGLPGPIDMDNVSWQGISVTGAPVDWMYALEPAWYHRVQRRMALWARRVTKAGKSRVGGGGVDYPVGQDYLSAGFLRAACDHEDEEDSWRTKPAGALERWADTEPRKYRAFVRRGRWAKKFWARHGKEYEVAFPGYFVKLFEVEKPEMVWGVEDVGKMFDDEIMRGYRIFYKEKVGPELKNKVREMKRDARRAKAPQHIEFPPMPTQENHHLGKVEYKGYTTADGVITQIAVKSPSFTRHHYVQRWMVDHELESITPTIRFEEGASKEYETGDFFVDGYRRMALNHDKDEEIIAKNGLAAVIAECGVRQYELYLENRKEAVAYWDDFPEQYAQTHGGKCWWNTRQEWCNDRQVMTPAATQTTHGQAPSFPWTSLENDAQIDQAILADPAVLKVVPKRTRSSGDNSHVADAEDQDPFGFARPWSERIFDEHCTAQDAFEQKLNELARGPVNSAMLRLQVPVAHSLHNTRIVLSNRQHRSRLCFLV
jgi:hypothetical protein